MRRQSSPTTKRDRNNAREGLSAIPLRKEFTRTNWSVTNSSSDALSHFHCWYRPCSLNNRGSTQRVSRISPSERVRSPHPDILFPPPWITHSCAFSAQMLRRAHILNQCEKAGERETGSKNVPGVDHMCCKSALLASITSRKYDGWPITCRSSSPEKFKTDIGMSCSWWTCWIRVNTSENQGKNTILRSV
jgi:hypothetical protein